MGLFQKIKSSDKSKDDLPGYVDNLLKDSKVLSNEEIDEKFSVGAMALNTSYSIDQVIALMRDLPSDAGNVVVSTVTKTLESAHIDVMKIVGDARNKENTLDNQISKLNEEIESLKKQITQKKDEINVSSAILEETKKVRELLENTKTGGLKSKPKLEQHRGQSNVSLISDTEAVKMALEAQ